MKEGDRDYDREHTTLLAHRARRRVGYSHSHGEVTEFVVQLEYRLDHGWVEIVRFDHDSKRQSGHDVTSEGIHLDVFRDGMKIRSEEVFPPMPANEALTFAEDHIARHAERYVKRFEEWHRIR